MQQNESILHVHDVDTLVYSVQAGFQVLFIARRIISGITKEEGMGYLCNFCIACLACTLPSCLPLIACIYANSGPKTKIAEKYSTLTFMECAYVVSNVHSGDLYEC